MKSINDYIVESIIIAERIRVDNLSMNTLPENLKRKYGLTYNPTTSRYDCDSDVYVYDDLIENGSFICNFGVVKGCFDCSGCKSLKTLEGAPKEVKGYFNCSGCKSLKTLEGAPKEVGGNFYCTYCPNIKDYNIKTKIGGKFIK